MTERKVNCVARKPFYLGKEVKTNLSPAFELSETEFRQRHAKGEVSEAPKPTKRKEPA